MRIISIFNLHPGMKLGRHIYGPNGEVLLRDQTELTGGYIRKLSSLGYTRLYIDDELSSDIETVQIVDDRLKRETVYEVKSLYDEIAGNPQHLRVNWNHLEAQLSDILDQMLEQDTLIYNMMDLKTFDNFTFSHCVSVAFLAIATGLELGMTRTELHSLAMGALMHDVGKMFIPFEIINKPEQLSEAEYAQMTQHPKLGYDYLKSTKHFPALACEAVYEHHERMDGVGYPRGLKDEEISEFGKLYAICDSFDAITSDRPYRKAWSPNEAMEYVMGNGNVRFDPDIAASFLKRIVPYPVGTIIKLSNNCTAIVVADNREVIARPVVRIFKEEDRRVRPYIVDLASQREYFNVTISGALDI